MGLHPTHDQVTATDRWIRRVIGIAILLVGGLFSYSWVFTDFEQRVQYQWESDEQGERIPVIHVTCPSPWSVVTQDAKPTGVVAGDLCVRPATGILLQSILFALVTFPLGFWVLLRSSRRRRELPELPPSVRGLLKR